MSLASFLAMSESDRAAWWYATAKNSDIVALRKAALGIVGAEVAITNAGDAAMKLLAADASAAADAARRAFEATYYASKA